MGLWAGAAPAGYAKGLVAQKDIITHGAKMGLTCQRGEIDIVKLSPLTGLRGDRSNQISCPVAKCCAGEDREEGGLAFF